MMKEQKGITLIALVITIIVLLILAGVSIAMLTGENGILTKATTAKTKTIEAELKEQVSLALGEIIADQETTNIVAPAEKTNGVAVGYTNGILKNWHENGINTIEAVEQMDKQFSSKIESNENSKENTEVIKNSFNNFNQRVYTDEEIMARLAEKNKKR